MNHAHETDIKPVGPVINRGQLDQLMTMKDLDTAPGQLNTHVTRNMEQMKLAEDAVRQNFLELAELAIKEQTKTAKEQKYALAVANAEIASGNLT